MVLETVLESSWKFLEFFSPKIVDTFYSIKTLRLFVHTGWEWCRADVGWCGDEEEIFTHRLNSHDWRLWWWARGCNGWWSRLLPQGGWSNQSHVGVGVATFLRWVWLLTNHMVGWLVCFFVIQAEQLGNLITALSAVVFDSIFGWP